MEKEHEGIYKILIDEFWHPLLSWRTQKCCTLMTKNKNISYCYDLHLHCHPKAMCKGKLPSFWNEIGSEGFYVINGLIH
jgi:hypothetical protein